MNSTNHVDYFTEKTAYNESFKHVQSKTVEKETFLTWPKHNSTNMAYLC